MGNEFSVDTRLDAKVPAAVNCLPGRQMAMQVTDEHYVLGNPIKPESFPDEIETVVFGTGCFWGTEKGFWRMPGVYSTAVGYTGGSTPNPTYQQVCSGMTGHNEVVQVAYDPSKIAFTDLLRMFWQSHDPTQGMGQGNDRGTQYRSGIYCSTEQQIAVASASLAAYQEVITMEGKGAGSGHTITTEVVHPAPTFYFAEDYHQQYLSKPGARPYCSAMPLGVQLPDPESWAPEGTPSPMLPAEYWAKHEPVRGCVVRGANDQIVWPSL